MMKISPRFFPATLLLTALLFFGVHAVPAQNGVVDLTTLANYAGQTIPPYITKNNTPPNNQISNAGATLGRILFYDKRLSRNSTVSCSSCHRQALAFSDSLPASLGVNGTTGRHSMRLVNARFGVETKFFWNERATSLENQTTQPIQDHTEMGFSGTLGDPALSDLVTRLTAIPEYRVLFAMTFGSSTINESRVQQVLAQFVRSIQSFDSKYDAGRAVANDNQPFPNFTANENNGKQLFLVPPQQGGAGCAGCHRPPEFDIDPNTRNNGIIGVIGSPGTFDLTNTRAPSLRNLVGPNGQPNGPYMHDATLATLANVIGHYNLIPNNPANTNLDNRLAGPGGNLNLNPQQRADLEAFLRTLTGRAVYTDAKWSTPFDANGNLSLIVLPASALTIQANNNGTATLQAKAAGNLAYQLQTSTDLQTWTTLKTLTSDANGNLSETVTLTPIGFFRFTFTPPN